MIIGIKDLVKLFAVTVVTGCAVFVCTLFFNYNMDLAGLDGKITSPQGRVFYEAQVATGKVVIGVTGGCLAATTAILLIFYIKNYIDSHRKELGILKALGYSDFRIAGQFFSFGLSVFFGSALGFAGAFLYMPDFYKAQNAEGLFPPMPPRFHFGLFLSLLLLPTVFFSALSVFSAFFRLRGSVISLLKEVQSPAGKAKKQTKELPFLTDLKRSTLTGRKIYVFFVGFSGFCFSAMTQMAMSMDDLASENFSWMMLMIGLILAFMTLFMSLASVVKANTKTIAMMKAFGYSENECSASVLGGYRPVSYIGFTVGTGYQYILLRLMMDLVFADFDRMPEYRFDVSAAVITLILFIVTYEGALFCYGRKIGKQSLKGIMLE